MTPAQALRAVGALIDRTRRLPPLPGGVREVSSTAPVAGPVESQTRFFIRATETWSRRGLAPGERAVWIARLSRTGKARGPPTESTLEVGLREFSVGQCQRR